MEYSFFKKLIAKWVVLCLVISVVACGAIYYLFFYQRDIKYVSKNQENQVESEILINDSIVAKTYTSDNYYVSVLWPPGWKIEKGDMGFLLSGKEGSFNIAWNGLGGACDEDKIKQFIKGEDAYWVCDAKPDGLYSYATINKTSNKDIAIGIIPAANYSSEDEKWVFFKVLENIKFDPQKIADWKMYDNSQHGFTLKYPENFFETGEPQITASQCAFENIPAECPNRMDEKIIIKGTQYCHSQRKEAVAGRAYYNDSYMTRNNDADSDKSCLSILLKTSEEDCQNYLPSEKGNEAQKMNYDNCLKENEARPKILETIVPTFKFTQ